MTKAVKDHSIVRLSKLSVRLSRRLSDTANSPVESSSLCGVSSIDSMKLSVAVNAQMDDRLVKIFCLAVFFLLLFSTMT